MVYVQLVSTNATSHTGISVPRPCTRTELTVRAVAGAAAQAFGQKTEPISRTLFEKNVTRIEPPDVRLCELRG